MTTFQILPRVTSKPVCPSWMGYSYSSYFGWDSIVVSKVHTTCGCRTSLDEGDTDDCSCSVMLTQNDRGAFSPQVRNRTISCSDYTNLESPTQSSMSFAVLVMTHDEAQLAKMKIPGRLDNVGGNVSADCSSQYMIALARLNH